MSAPHTFRGQLSISPYGKFQCSLFPIEDSSFLDCRNESLMDLLYDMWRFFHSREKEGKVHSRTVRKGKTSAQNLKTLRFSAGFLDFILIEHPRFPDTRINMSVEIPWTGGSFDLSEQDR